jgi:hypothetical protein
MSGEGSMFTSVSKAMESQKTYRCPCCEFKTLYGSGGFEICPVCYWEDDGQDDHDASEVRGGPNGELSLAAARENFGIHRAVEPRFIANVRNPLEDEL